MRIFYDFYFRIIIYNTISYKSTVGMSNDVTLKNMRDFILFQINHHL